jgi:hypothetical protein
MKQFLLFYTLLGGLFAQAQVSKEKIRLYAKHLALRNAHLIQCDSMAPKLEVFYIEFMQTGFLPKHDFRSRMSASTFGQLQHYFHKEILSVLKGKPKRIYRRLWRATGNILLIRRRL